MTDLVIERALEKAQDALGSHDFGPCGMDIVCTDRRSENCECGKHTRAAIVAFLRERAITLDQSGNEFAAAAFRAEADLIERGGKPDG